MCVSRTSAFVGKETALAREPPVFLVSWRTKEIVFAPAIAAVLNISGTPRAARSESEPEFTKVPVISMATSGESSDTGATSAGWT